MASKKEIERIIRAALSDPFEILGAHLEESDGVGRLSIRAFMPGTEEVFVLDSLSGTSTPMEKLHADGFFEAIFPGQNKVFPYRLKAINGAGVTTTFADPYSFLPILSEFDLYLIGEGTHHNQYEKLGAHLMTVAGAQGVLFALWAPNAVRVSVVGDFNEWDCRRHMMRARGSTGIWELFIPGLGEGVPYKFEVKPRTHGYPAQKADPYAFYSEIRPKSASIVWDLNKYQWNDQDWLDQRSQRNWLESPVSIYEIHLGSWKRVPEEDNRWLTYRELAHSLVPYIRDMGYTHVEIMPVSEHPLDESWGYQTTGYFSATSRYGTPEDLMYLIDRFHQANIGVILDWVPGHFPKDGHGLAAFDGSALYEHDNPLQGEHRDWGTLIFNYGRTEVAGFLISNALFWLEKYHVDGLRVDAVASMLYLDYSRKPGEWVPNEFGGNENIEAIAFLKRLNEIVHGKFPGVLTIAEESTAWPAVSRPTYLGGLGFSMKWNMGWMNDILSYFESDPVFRRYHHNNLTFALLYAFSENFVLVLSHDEVVHGKKSLIGKMPGDEWQRFANLRLLYTYMFAQPGKKLLFMGGEFGQWQEWDASGSLHWHLIEHDHHRGVQRLVKDLNQVYRSEKALHEYDFCDRGFEWIDFGDYQQSVVSFLRKGHGSDDFLLFIFNFTPVPRYGYMVGVPLLGIYEEILNSDAGIYGGSDCGNGGACVASAIAWHGRPYSLSLTLPPLGAIAFKLRR